MQLYGLIGRPLGHSFSAAFFAEKFQREGIEAQYLNFPLQTIEELPALLAAHPDLQGFNVTIPYKQAVQAYLADIAPEAREIGAVNVVKVVAPPQPSPEGRGTHCHLPAEELPPTQGRVGEGLQLYGYNTDVIGFSRSLRPLLQPHHRRALVLGTGGASLAVVYALRRLGIEPVYVSRTVAADRLTYADLTPEVMHSHLLIVNCSPVGMYPHVDAAPAIPYDLLTPRHLLYDLVYNPDETRFMQLGAARGATVKNGLEMLHLQALAAWEIWNN